MHLFVTCWFTLFVAAKLTQVNRRPNKVSLSAALSMVNWEEMQKEHQTDNCNEATIGYQWQGIDTAPFINALIW